MSAKNSREERTYRRGLVMGLTMAEIMVLVIFALLLILAKVLTEETTRLPAAFTGLMNAWRQAGTGENQFDDKAQELVTASELGSAVIAALSDSKDAPTLSSQRTVQQDVVKRATELIKTGRQAEQAVGANSMGLTQQQAIREFLTTSEAEFNRARQSRGSGSSRIWLTDVIRRAKQAEGGGNGKGTEHPPCSSTDGKPDFIFDVHLGSATITVHDNNISDASIRANWPLASIQFDKAVSRPAFLEMTKPLFQWGAKNQCRFFVRIVDDTLAHEKSIYKIQLRAVGYHFYYYEPLGSAADGRD